MTIKWNRIYTDLLRRDWPKHWGNWALNPHIQPGAVGIVDPASGDFKLVLQTLPGIEVIKSEQSRMWKTASKGVSRQETKTIVKGQVLDPATSTQIAANASLEWTFKDQNSITSEFALSGEHVLKDSTVIQDQYEQLLAYAKRTSAATEAGISEGFGVVTGVIYAKSGVNVGSKKKNAKFSIAGSVSGLNKLLGESDPIAKGEASYLIENNTEDTDSHTLPAESGAVASEPLPVAYTFASFAGGNVLIPHWTRRIGALNLHIDSKASSFTTYTAKIKLLFKTPKGLGERTATIVGGTSASFNDIPVSATQMTLFIEFISLGQNTKQEIPWNLPAVEWPTGTRTINLVGTWPGAPKAIEVVD
ncbi:hypothetical protein [Pseudomonas sp. Irchel 3F5]|uniref:hypothetical protein n=1 Tax=Pseudomonas sp. Irchel 3F5 TaxID=2009002 RepID=UPI000BA2F210|nr:hypothetical protein [Pseudomonas sp. Irchel 3F5]